MSVHLFPTNFLHPVMKITFNQTLSRFLYDSPLLEKEKGKVVNLLPFSVIPTLILPDSAGIMSEIN